MAIRAVGHFAVAGALGAIGLAWVVAACGSFGVTDADAKPNADADASADPNPNANPNADGGGADALAAPSGPAVDLATGQPSPKDIVVDATNVYWLTTTPGVMSGAVMRLPKKPNPGTPEVFADGGIVARYAEPYAMRGDPTSIYWSSGPELQRLNKNGGSPQQVLWYGQSDTDGDYQGFAIQAGTVYATGTARGSEIFSCGTDGTSKLTLESNLGDVKVVTTDGAYVYGGATGAIVRVPVAGVDAGPPFHFATASGAVRGIASDETTIYWVDVTGVHSLAKSAAGEMPTDLATRQNAPSAIALDAAYVYWTNAGDGLVQVVAKAGGKPQALSQEGMGQPSAIAVDTSGVFWTNYADGRIRAIWR